MEDEAKGCEGVEWGEKPTISSKNNGLSAVAGLASSEPAEDPTMEVKYWGDSQPDSSGSSTSLVDDKRPRISDDVNSELEVSDRPTLLRSILR